MKRWNVVPWFVVVVIMVILPRTPLLAANPTAIAQGAVSFDIEASKVFYESRPGCVSIIPTDMDGEESEYNEEISRVPTYGGLDRTLYRKAVGIICGTQIFDLTSNLIADEEYVYWLSGSGVGLVRLPVTANPGDEPELVSDAVSGSGEIAQDEEAVFVLLTGAETIWRIEKSDGSAMQLVGSTGPSPHDLQIDGHSLFWISDETLKRGLASQWNTMIQLLAGGVTGYYAEGRRFKYLIGGIPVFSEYLYYAQGSVIKRYDVLAPSSGHTTVYTSTDPYARIRDLVTAGISYLLGDHALYFFEHRESCGDLFCDVEIWLFRIKGTGGATEPLYMTEYSEVFLGDMPDKVTEEDGFLFWLEDGYVVRFPADAPVLANVRPTELEITQGVQDLANSVQLIKNRRTFVRLYAVSDGPDPVPGVTAYLYRVNSLGLAIDGPLLPVNPVGKQITLQTNPSRADINHAFLFELPWSWTTDSLRLRAVVNPNNIPLEPPEPGSADNTLYSSTFYFEDSPRLQVQFVSFGYILNNQFYYPRLIDDVFQAYSWIRRAYPLASTPGGASDPSPGFRPNLWIVADDELGSRVNRTHADCLAMDSDYRNLCASAYTNTMMNAMRVEDGVSSDIFMYGMISDAAGFFPRGQACCGEKVSSGPVGMPDAASWDTDTSYGDWYAAHEIGHTLGRGHPAENADDPATQNVVEGCGHSPDDNNYPYADAKISPPDDRFAGFDVGDSSFDLPYRIYPGLSWYDIMSYCKNEWISDYTYDAMYDAMAGASATATADTSGMVGTSAYSGDFLSVFGLIYPETKKATIHRLRRLSEVGSIPPMQAGAYSIRLVNSSGIVLADYPFTVQRTYDTDIPTVSFGQIVDFLRGTSSVQIVEPRSGTVLVSKKISPNPPVVDNVRLVDAREPVSVPVTLAWDATDPDGGTLRFDTFYSVDDGVSFQPLHMNLREKSVTIDTSMLAGSARAVFKVMATDGVNTGQADSPPFVMADKAPLVRILSPGDGYSIHYGQLVNFSGEVQDLQDGILSGADLVWTRGSEVIGTGTLISKDDLLVGPNEIILSATNSSGLTARDTITVLVDDDLTLPGPAISTAPSFVGWQVSAGTTAIQSATLTISNAGGGGILNWTATEDAPWLSVGDDTGTVPAELTLFADPSGIPVNATVNTNLVLSSDDPEVDSLSIPVSLAVGDVWRDIGKELSLADLAGEFGRAGCAGSACFADLDQDSDVDARDVARFGATR